MNKLYISFHLTFIHPQFLTKNKIQILIHRCFVIIAIIIQYFFYYSVFLGTSSLFGWQTTFLQVTNNFNSKTKIVLKTQ